MTAGVECRTAEELERHDVVQFWIEGVAQVSRNGVVGSNTIHLLSPITYRIQSKKIIKTPKTSQKEFNVCSCHSRSGGTLFVVNTTIRQHTQGARLLQLLTCTTVAFVCTHYVLSNNKRDLNPIPSRNLNVDLFDQKPIRSHHHITSHHTPHVTCYVTSSVTILGEISPFGLLFSDQGIFLALKVVQNLPTILPNFLALLLWRLFGQLLVEFGQLFG